MPQLGIDAAALSPRGCQGQRAASCLRNVVLLASVGSLFLAQRTVERAAREKLLGSAAAILVHKSRELAETKDKLRTVSQSLRVERGDALERARRVKASARTAVDSGQEAQPPSEVATGRSRYWPSRIAIFLPYVRDAKLSVPAGGVAAEQNSFRIQ